MTVIDYMSEWFEINLVVHYGCVLSPWLINVFVVRMNLGGTEWILP